MGYRIAEEELGGDERSEYGLGVIKKISPCSNIGAGRNCLLYANR